MTLETVDGRPVQGGSALPVFFMNGGFMPLDLISNVQGAILYRSATGWVALLPGTAAKVLTTHGPDADPTWEETALPGAGTITDAMLAEVATATFKGRTTAGTGAVETLTAAQALAMLTAAGMFTGAKLTRVSLASAVTGLAAPYGSTVPFDTEDVDENGAWSVGSPDKFVIPTTGIWRVQFSAYAQIDAGTGVEFELLLTRGGNTEVASGYLSSTNAVAYQYLTATFVRNLTALDEVTFGYSIASGVGPSCRLFAGSFATLEKLK
jgi:hypothetical protein